MLTPNLSSLQQQWLQLGQLFEVDQKQLQSIFELIISAYNKPERFYHNLDHIHQVLNVITELQDLAEDLPSIQLAAWFHDIIYNPQLSDNEQQSANYATMTLEKLQIPQLTIAKVNYLILETVSHQAQLKDINAQILLDADLSILGTTWTEYNHYRQAIRQEYNWLDETQFQQGRIRVLKSFLSRNTIYQTLQLQRQRELQARANLTQELGLY